MESVLVSVTKLKYHVAALSVLHGAVELVSGAVLVHDAQHLQTAGRASLKDVLIRQIEVYYLREQLNHEHDLATVALRSLQN